MLRQLAPLPLVLALLTPPPAEAAPPAQTAIPAQAAPPGLTDWLDVQGSAMHAGYQSNAGLLGAPRHRSWSTPDRPSRSPLAVDGSLYYPESTTITRRAFAGTRQPFAPDASAAFWIGQPVSDGRSLYALFFDRYGHAELRALTLTGRVRWKVRIPGENTGDNTATANGQVLTTTGQACTYTCATSVIRSYSTTTGAERWHQTIQGEAAFDRPTITPTRVLWPTAQPRTALEAATPETTAARGAGAIGEATAAVEAGAAFQAHASAAGDVPNGWRLTALEATTGAEAWHATGPGSLRGTAADTTTVYTAADQLCARALTDGTVRWCRTDRPYDTVAVAPTAVYATTAGHLLSLDPADGHIRWDAPIGSDPVHPPVVTGGMVLLHHDVGEQSALLALSAQDGHRLSGTNLGHGLPGMLTVAAGYVFAVHDYTGLVAVRP
ncbi:PQQ-binding-like beta-propeller repeat protein [Dactylosporangium vinaceum]|uniref:PQQ-binding-like beta-propeller repeat protein n=1 Tax=Dactylosporangium vinaceum TaxID=53362 RepID=A0ABV5M413_9ACTN|nr:PQQ-binding-like beta-propeller repeat protein [Dactylosporangium vinaceum]UAB93482.1 PQQ-binding-like beta-propeller repeat protein [Dactylosporangium vinaceum]